MMKTIFSLIFIISFLTYQTSLAQSISYPSGGGGGTAVINSVNAPLDLTAGVLSIPQANATQSGFLSSGDWTTFNNKGSGTVTSVSGTAPVVSSGGNTPAISMPKATTSQSGFLSSGDWTTFNAKSASFTSGNLTDAGTDGIVVTSGTGAVIGSGTSFAQSKATTTQNGYLSSADWTTFNNKTSSQWVTSGSNIYYSAGNVAVGQPGTSRVLTGFATDDGLGTTGILSTDPSMTDGLLVTPSSVEGVVVDGSGNIISLGAELGINLYGAGNVNIAAGGGNIQIGGSGFGSQAGLLMTNNATATTLFASSTASNDSNGGDLLLKGGRAKGTGSSNVRIFTATAGSSGSANRTPSEKLTILGSGNVGVDIATPAAALVVKTHQEYNGTAPTIGSGVGDCGTSPSVVGNDSAGRVTVGSSTNGGTCTVTFNASWNNAPICTAFDETTGVLVRPTSVSTSAFKITGVIVAGDALSYHCVGYE